MPRSTAAHAAIRPPFQRPGAIEAPVAQTDSRDAARPNACSASISATLKPGAASSQRHWHEKEDEFVYVLQGEIVLIEDERRDRAQARRCGGAGRPAFAKRPLHH